MFIVFNFFILVNLKFILLLKRVEIIKYVFYVFILVNDFIFIIGSYGKIISFVTVGDCYSF